MESLKFINDFYGIKPTERDFDRFEKFKEAIRLKDKFSYSKISQILNFSRDTISDWINFKQLPFIIQMLKVYKNLGNPNPGYKWLTINVGFGQTLDGSWIQVPIKIKSFDEIKRVISQLNSLPNSVNKTKKLFRITDLEKLKLEAFAYVLGFVVGDMGKRKAKKTNTRIKSRILSLKLTSKIKTNLYLGEFITDCVKALGFRMKRYKDQIDKVTGSIRYYWESQSSLFFEWIFRVCLGLKDNETTTYNPIRMEWIFNTPEFFKKRFIHGIADSDGGINMQSKCCDIASYPNTDFIKKLLEQFNLKVRINKMADGPVVALTPNEAFKLPLFFPSETVSYRYSDLKSYVNAFKKIGRGTPKNIQKIIRHYSKNGKGKAEIMKILAHKHKIILSYRTLSRYYSG